MNCNKIHERLIFLLSDDLNSSERKEISDHLFVCERCRSDVEKLKSAWKILEEEKSNRRDFHFVNRVMRRIEARESEQKKWFSAGTLRILRPSLVSVLAAAAIFTGIFLGSKVSIRFTMPENRRAYEVEAFAYEYFPDELMDENIETVFFIENNR
jgi:anti-sigma factor RsiW